MDNTFPTYRDEALTDWINAILASYPFESTGFLRTNKDRFANPVGYTTEQSAAVLCDAVIGADVDDETTKDALAALLRIRTVQDFAPSQAVGVLLLLKPILRDTAARHGISAAILRAAEDRVDTLTLMAFDLYAEDKDAMYRGRVDEIRRRYKTIERWMAKQGVDGLIPDEQDTSGDHTGNIQGER